MTTITIIIRIKNTITLLLNYEQTLFQEYVIERAQIGLRWPEFFYKLYSPSYHSRNNSCTPLIYLDNRRFQSLRATRKPPGLVEKCVRDCISGRCPASSEVDEPLHHDIELVDPNLQRRHGKTDLPLQRFHSKEFVRTCPRCVQCNFHVNFFMNLYWWN